MKKVFFYICCFSFFLIQGIKAQDMNAKITINTDKIQGVDRSVFTELEQSLTQLLNERKWTDAAFGINERIECTFVLTLNTVSNGSSYSGELQVSSRRPVYGSSYITPMFAYKDIDITFDYLQGETLDFNETSISNNLVAIIAYYSYIIAGLDFDSYELNGGKPYFERAMNIVNASQSLAKKGWAAFDDDRNRYALALALTEETSTRFHDMWYNYHRLGLDEMSTNVLRGRDRIIASLKDLQVVHSARPSSALVFLFGDTKLSELVDIYTEASADEKKEAYELLRRLFPTKSNLLDAIKKPK